MSWAWLALLLLLPPSSAAVPALLGRGSGSSCSRAAAAGCTTTTAAGGGSVLPATTHSCAALRSFPLLQVRALPLLLPPQLAAAVYGCRPCAVGERVETGRHSITRSRSFCFPSAFLRLVSYGNQCLSITRVNGTHTTRGDVIPPLYTSSTRQSIPLTTPSSLNASSQAQEAQAAPQQKQQHKRNEGDSKGDSAHIPTAATR